MMMKFVGRRWVCATAVAVLALAGWNAATFAQEKKPEPPKPKDIVTLAKDAANLKIFCELVETAGLAETLKGKGPFTVFAPTDDAFNKLGPEKLADLKKPENKTKLVRILKHHVLSERKAAADLEKDEFTKSLAGEYLTIVVKDGVVMVEKAKVTKANIEASNGLVHVIDAVLIPAETPAKPQGGHERSPE